nr:hypothetical protein [uncultured Undibacterium sp.]
MNSVEERNYAGQYYVNTRLEVAKTKSDSDFMEFQSSAEIHDLLSDLIEVNAKGFRGIVVTALTGMHLDASYDPLENFYGCNPRAIFEGGIWYALQENGIPCGKSDPLNVAKNANRLDANWAQGRRPQSAAMAVVNFLKLVVDASKSKKARLIDYFFYRLWRFAQSVTTFELVEIINCAASRQAIGAKLIAFTLKYPESGTLPQFLVSQLLTAIFFESNINVKGGNESVFGTNTTSKKPADIWLENNEIQTNLYEVTVKPVNKKRLDDSLDALKSTGHFALPVTFICRFPEDIAGLEIHDGTMIYKNKNFDFVDYRSFCSSLFAVLDDDKFSGIVSALALFIKDKQISMKTKSGWNEFFDI